MAVTNFEVGKVYKFHIDDNTPNSVYLDDNCGFIIEIFGVSTWCELKGDCSNIDYVSLEPDTFYKSSLYCDSVDNKSSITVTAANDTDIYFRVKEIGDLGDQRFKNYCTEVDTNNLSQYITILGNAIRTASGIVTTLNPQDFASKIVNKIKKPQQEKEVTPQSYDQEITADYGYELGSVTVSGDSDLIQQNIRKGVNIFGVTGTCTGSGSTLGWNGSLDLTLPFEKYGTYGFIWDSQYNRLIPSNRGVNSSYAMAKIPFTVTSQCDITVNMYQNSEINYDYGFLSNLDTLLVSSTTATDNNTVQLGGSGGQAYGSKGKSGEFSYTFSNVPVGEHFITVKYRKDGSGHTGNDVFAITSIVSSNQSQSSGPAVQVYETEIENGNGYETTPGCMYYVQASGSGDSHIYIRDDDGGDIWEKEIWDDENLLIQFDRINNYVLISSDSYEYSYSRSLSGLVTPFSLWADGSSPSTDNIFIREIYPY